MKKIAIDMDGVMAMTPHKALEWYERDFGIKLTEDDIKGKNLSEIFPAEHLKIVGNYLRQKGYFADLDVMPHCQEVMLELHEKYELFIATAATQFPTSYVDKQNWLAKYFPFIDWKHIVFCGKKSIIHADYMIDDYAYNLDDFAGEGLLFTAYHNANSESPYHRVDSWLDVREYFSKIE